MGSVHSGGRTAIRAMGGGSGHLSIGEINADKTALFADFSEKQRELSNTLNTGDPFPISPIMDTHDITLKKDALLKPLLDIKHAVDELVTKAEAKITAWGTRDNRKGGKYDTFRNDIKKLKETEKPQQIDDPYWRMHDLVNQAASELSALSSLYTDYDKGIAAIVDTIGDTLERAEGYLNDNKTDLADRFYTKAISTVKSNYEPLNDPRYLLRQANIYCKKYGCELDRALDIASNNDLLNLIRGIRVKYENASQAVKEFGKKIEEHYKEQGKVTPVTESTVPGYSEKLETCSELYYEVLDRVFLGINQIKIVYGSCQKLATMVNEHIDDSITPSDENTVLSLLEVIEGFCQDLNTLCEDDGKYVDKWLRIEGEGHLEKTAELKILDRTNAEKDIEKYLLPVMTKVYAVEKEMKLTAQEGVVMLQDYLVALNRKGLLKSISSANRVAGKLGIQLD